MLRRLSAAAILSLLVSAPLHAAPILFLDRATFLQATQPNQAIPFSGEGFSGCQPFVFPICHRTFENLFHVSYDFAGIGLFGESVGLGRVGGLSSANEFLQPVIAIGFDLVEILPAFFLPPTVPPPTTANFTFAGTTFTLPVLTEPIFFGAIFDTPQLTIPASASGGFAGPDGGYVITNLVVQTVPEPGTLALLGIAAAGVVASRRFANR